MVAKRRRTKHIFRSDFERKISEQLNEECIEWQYERDKFSYDVPARVGTYTTDFTIKGRDKLIFVETKGKLDLEDRKKLKLIKEQYPDMDLRLLFMRDNKIRKGSKTTYSKWAEKNGFKYAIKRIPKEWIKEMRYL